MDALIMRRRMLFLVACALAGWLAGSIGLPADSRDGHGLPVGATAPAFRLLDQDGREHSLSGLLQPGKWVALVFYRSADW
jgi:hypothetical protein